MFKPFQYLFEQFLQYFVHFVIVFVEILMIYDDYHSNYLVPLNHLYVINKKKLTHYDMLFVILSKILILNKNISMKIFERKTSSPSC